MVKLLLQRGNEESACASARTGKDGPVDAWRAIRNGVPGCRVTTGRVTTALGTTGGGGAGSPGGQGPQFPRGSRGFAA